MTPLEISLRLAAGLALILTNGFFVAIEFALTRARQFSIANRGDNGRVCGEDGFRDGFRIERLEIRIAAASTRANDFDDSDVYFARILAANVHATLDRARREQALRRRGQELQRQNDRLDEFAGVVSHDLRNPLNVAMGRLELARGTGETEHFEAIARAQKRMERIIEDVLTLARLSVPNRSATL